MRLSLLILAYNAEAKLARFLPELGDVGDELVIGVDDSTTDGTAEVARRFTAKVYPVPHRSFFGRGRAEDLNAVECMLPHCGGDWILRIDHDETLSPLWHDRGYVEGLFADRAATHWSIPRRMVVPPGDRFIASGVWYPDYQLRLFRNIPSLIEFNRRPHERPRIAGEQRFLSEAWILHWKDGPSVLDERVFRTRPLDYIYPTRPARSLEKTDTTDPAGDPFRASLEVLDCAGEMRAGQAEPVLVAITNRSDRVLRPSSSFIRQPDVYLSWHWFTAENSKIYLWEGERLEIPKSMAPGESVARFMTVTAPDEAGEYLLQPDLVEEFVAWFSAHCAIPKHPVRVTGARTKP
jgi:hypothetical protein